VRSRLGTAVLKPARRGPSKRTKHECSFPAPRPIVGIGQTEFPKESRAQRTAVALASGQYLALDDAGLAHPVMSEAWSPSRWTPSDDIDIALKCGHSDRPEGLLQAAAPRPAGRPPHRVLAAEIAVATVSDVWCAGAPSRTSGFRFGGQLRAHQRRTPLFMAHYAPCRIITPRLGRADAHATWSTVTPSPTRTFSGRIALVDRSHRGQTPTPVLRSSDHVETTRIPR